jgi:hypothetical protein
MKFIVGLLAVMSIGALSQALAAEPEPPSPAAATPTQDSPPAQQGTSPPDLQAGAKPPVVDPNTPASATAATKASVVIKGDKPELTSDEQQLIKSGYKLEVRHGENWFCRREQVLGSRLGDKKVCGTASMLFQTRKQQQDELRGSQKYLNAGQK